MVRYDKFLPKLMLQVIDCPEPVAIDAIRSACIEFCERSLWLVHEPEPMPLVAGASTYPLDTPADTVPVMVIAAWAAGLPLASKSPEAFGGSTDWRDQSGSPTAYLQYTPDELVLIPVPDTRVEDGLKMQVAIRPSQDSTTVDDSVYEWWYETIVAGALAKLYGHAGRGYSNPQAIPGQQAAFDGGISDARAKRQRALGRGPLSVRMRRW